MITGPPDATLALQAAVTKTASFDSLGLDLGSGFAVDEPGQPMVGEVNVTAMDLTSGNETYSFVLQQSSDNITFAACGAAIAATAVGVVLAKGFVTQRYVRLSMTAAGTTPSITYAADLYPMKL